MKLLLVALLTLPVLAEVVEIPHYTSKEQRAFIRGNSPLEKSSQIAPKPHALIKIAIIDTGYDAGQAFAKIKLCKTGHFDFATNTPVLASTNPHGTMVASLIAQGLDGVNYCAVIYQVNGPEGVTFENLIGAFAKAEQESLQAINLSIQGYKYSFFEKAAITRVALRGTHVFVAAGNDNLNLDEACNSYPGCYSIRGLHMVGAMNPDYSSRASYSNYGSRVELWYPGFYQTVMEYGKGTSFAAPRALADYVYSLAVGAGQ